MRCGAEHRSDASVRSYTESARMLVAFLGGAEALDASTEDLRRFIAHLLTHRSPATAAVRYRSLQQFYGWAVRDGLIDTNPMTTMRPPTMPEQAVPVVPVEDLRKLLKPARGGTSSSCGTRRSSGSCSSRAGCAAPRSSA